MIQRWGAMVARRATAVLVAGAAALVLSIGYGVGVFGALSDGGFDDPASESAKELTAEQATFDGHRTDVVAIYSSPDLAVTDPAFEAAVHNVVDRLPSEAVTSVEPYYVPKGQGLMSSDGHAAMVVLSLAGTTQDTRSASYDAIKDKLAADGLTTRIGGPSAVFGDVNETVSADIARAESLTMPLVFLLSLVIFGSAVAALMPTLVGAVAVFGAFAALRLLTTVTDVSIFAINIITLIGMGLAIDYALFIVSRFREELATQPGSERQHVRAAVERTMSTAGRTVLFSGLTVAASLASLLIFPQNFLRSMGYGGVAAVLVAMTAALTILPATLAVLGPRIEAGRMPWRRSRRATLVTGSATASRWAAVAHSVMRRPVAYLVVIVVALGALAIPFLSATWGSVDYRVLPSSAPSHQAALVQAERFGGETSTASIVVSGAQGRQLTEYVDELAQVDGVTSAQAAEQTVAASSGDAVQALVQVRWPGNDQSEKSQRIVDALRSVDPGAGASALVGGASAQTVDLLHSIGAHLPWMGLVVVVVMLVLLFFAFGSVVLPIKAVVMNVDVHRRLVRGRHVDLRRRPSVGSAGLHVARVLGRDPADPHAGHLVRSVDGLRGVPAVPRPRGVGSHARQHGLGGDRAAAQWPHHHQRRPAARGRHRRLCDVQRRVHQDDRHRHAGRGAAGRHGGSGLARAGHDAAARRGELVGAGSVTPVVGAPRSARGRRQRQRAGPRAGAGRRRLLTHPTTLPGLLTWSVPLIRPHRQSCPQRHGCTEWMGRGVRLTRMSDVQAGIAVIGGSGFYEFLDAPRDVSVSTPYGDPSSAVSIGQVNGRAVAFLPRHGRHHEFPAHQVNYRANVWALRSLGVRRILAPCAVGSLQPELGPGAVVVPDQLVDRTASRIQTYFDSGACHVGFADPYCPSLRGSLTAADDEIVDGGAMVVIEGPRFSTRAESQWYAAQGWSLVNMTGHPEAVLARELALCYAAIALVTDRDAGVGSGESVSQAEVFAAFAANLDRLRDLLVAVIDKLPDARTGCACEHTLDGFDLPLTLP